VLITIQIPLTKWKNLKCAVGRAIYIEDDDYEGVGEVGVVVNIETEESDKRRGGGGSFRAG
jgi:hypothetical protein